MQYKIKKRKKSVRAAAAQHDNMNDSEFNRIANRQTVRRDYKNDRKNAMNEYPEKELQRHQNVEFLFRFG